MIDRIRRLWDAGRDLEARLLLAAHVMGLAASTGVRAVLVGGSAVDFYTAGALERAPPLPGPLRGSVDLDFVVARTATRQDAQAVRGALAEGGFAPLVGQSEARTWWHPRLPGLGVDVMPGPLEGSAQHIRELVVADITVPLIGPEDLLVQYLEAAVATRHAHDYTRAVALAWVHGETMDWDYVAALAQAAGLAKQLGLTRNRAPFSDVLAL